MSTYSDLAVKGLKVLIEDYESVCRDRTLLYAAIEQIAEMRIETENDRIEVIKIARKALNECD